MNIQRLAVLLSGLILLSCIKPGEGPAPIENPENRGVESNYSILLSQEGFLNSVDITADAVEISTPNSENQALPLETEMLFYRQGNSISFLNSLPGCNAGIHFWEPGGNVFSVEKIFPDDDNCERKIIAFAHLQNTAYLAYSLPGTGMKEVLYFVKALSLESGESVFDDIAMQNEPLQLVSYGSRLYALTFDSLSGKNTLEVINADTGAVELASDLGTGVVKIINTPEGNILVSYESRHMLLHSSTMEVLSRVQYLDGKEPDFAHSESYYFDPSGVLYYAMPTNPAESFALHIPAVYDFSKYTAYLYFFENFLSEERLKAYDIGDTRSVAFDHKNGLLLIGYEKAQTPGKGGLLRVKPVPEPEFIDQTDLEGVPLILWAQ